MNQILETKLNNKKSKFIKSKKILKFQFYCSIFLIAVISVYIIFNTLKLNKQEKYSSELLNNYNITKLYSNLSSESNKSVENPYVIGIIEITKIGIYYPIFSDCTDELLKVSPCKFYGPSPGEVGNLCIAGHNYDNDKFFSKIASLSINDEIILYSNSNKKFSYLIFEIYEVKSDDLSPVYSYDKNSKQLTLITCNNMNNNRIIVKAFCKD